MPSGRDDDVEPRPQAFAALDDDLVEGLLADLRSIEIMRMAAGTSRKKAGEAVLS